MTENIDKEPLGNLANIKSENTSDEIITTIDIETINPNQETENMEVHHHTHHEGIKNWRSYAWEFLMLFLAVFCGFLAEYFLEHRIEKEKGKQFVESMIADIISDSTKINETLILCKRQGLGLDSLAKIVLTTPYTESSIKKLYYLHFIYLRNAHLVNFTKRTISQLKNGGMRLIKNKVSSDEITAYNENTEEIEKLGNYFLYEEIAKLKYYNFKLFDMTHFINLSPTNSDSIFTSALKLKLINNDEKLLKEYGYFIIDTKQVLDGYIYHLTEIQKRIPKTIETLKKENHLK